MSPSLKSSIIGLTALGGVAMAAPAAWAGCGDGALHQASWQAGSNAELLMPVFNPASASIVGMWSIQMFAGGAQVDFGYQQWHGDGTEFMNSGGRAPSTQNFCLGVWAQTGPSSYHLNHFALSYSPSGVLNGKVNIKEDVTVDRTGNAYSGPFTIDVYDPNNGSLLQHVAGRVNGQRVPLN
jgi:hypothetical protein